MRVLRHKHNRKTLSFFRVCFHIHTPYKLLLDGNFLAQAAKMRVDEQESLRKLLEDDGVFVHVTECVMAELEALGSAAAHVCEHARRLPLIRCRHKYGHTKGMDARSCITRLIGKTNDKKFFVATQDAELRDELRAVPGVPLLLFSHNVLVLEPPSKASRERTTAAEHAKLGLSAQERTALKAAAKSAARKALADSVPELLRDGARAGADAAENEGPDDSADDDADSVSDASEHGGVAAAAAAAAVLRAAGADAPRAKPRAPAGAAAAAGQKRRRKGPSGPNPLSMKKKKPKTAAPAAHDEAGRKRRRHGGGAPRGGEAGGAAE